MTTTKKKPLSTYERFIQDPKRRAALEKEYKEFILSELLLALMESDEISVRKLAKEAGLSASVIQSIRSGEQEDIRLSNFKNIAEACGYHLVLEKGKEKILI
jgi:DNA-binding Xre family transcriptional regulator